MNFLDAEFVQEFIRMANRPGADRLLIRKTRLPKMYMHINETGQYHQRRSIHRKNTAPAGNTIPNGSGSITDQEMARAIALRILQYDVHSARPFHTNFFYHTMPAPACQEPTAKTAGFSRAACCRAEKAV